MEFGTAKSGAVSAVFAAFGSGAIFTPAGGPAAECRVVVKAEEVPRSDSTFGQVYEFRKTVRYRLSDIARNVARGETFTVGGAVYVVEEMTVCPNQELTRKAIVKEQAAP